MANVSDFALSESSIQRSSETGDYYTTGVSGFRKGAEPEKPRPAQVTIRDSQGKLKKEDLRVRIKVPVDYIKKPTSGIYNELAAMQGIVFPYTPQISFDNKADYSTIAPTHSNYNQYFYQRSGVSQISLVGKFTVQNEKDAGVYLATMHLLKSLTKMRYGTDFDSGSPPPVCRLFAYGKFMLDNVPIVISNYRIELPEGVDYFTLGKVNSDREYGQASVPTLSTFNISCYVVYSRQEMQEFSVQDYLNNFADDDVRSKGYL